MSAPGRGSTYGESGGMARHLTTRLTVMRSYPTVLVLAGVLVFGHVGAQAGPLTLAQIANTPRYAVRDMAISPDGRYVAYIRLRVGNAIYEEPTLWVVPTSGGQPRLLGKAGLPVLRWAPNGREIQVFDYTSGLAPLAFLAHTPARIFAYDIATGKARTVFAVSVEGSDFAWSPDGKNIAIIGSDIPRAAGSGKPPAASNKPAGPRQDWLANKWSLPLQAQPEVGFRGFGFTNSIFAFPPPEEQLLMAASDGHVHRKRTLHLVTAPESLAWSSDGSKLTVVAIGKPDFQHPRAAVYIAEIDARSLSVTRRSPNGCFSPTYLGRSNVLAYLCATGTAAGADVFVGGADVSRGLDRSAYEGDLSPFGLSAGWTASDDSSDVLAAFWDGAASRLYRRVKNEWTALTPANQTVSRFCAAQGSGAIAYAATDEENGVAIYAIDPRGTKPRRLAVVDPPLAATKAVTVRDVHWRAGDGQVLNGIVLLPAGDAHSAPLLVDLHGGPQLAWTHDGDLQAAYFASHGYVVFKPNPRGSAGYGAWSFASIRNDWANGPSDDVVRGIDAVERLGFGDHKREFVRGDSYGGYLSAWLVEHVKRFSAAESGFAPYDLTLHYDFTDGPPELEAFFGPHPLSDNMATFVAQSPQTDASLVSVPILIVAGRVDHRVPYAISLLFYKTLAERGVDTRLLLFDSEPHGLDTWHLAYLLRAEATWYGSHGGLSWDDKLP